MIIRGVSLPGGEPPGEDRWGHTDTGVIVLDGATPGPSVDPRVEEYVDVLLGVLSEKIDGPADIRVVLADAIGAVAAALDLRPGAAPSSTVAVLREREDVVEVAVLGDSTIVLGFADGAEERLADDRIAHVAADRRAAIGRRLEDGNGYDDRHRTLLHGIRLAERRARNTDDGYWIAEADSRAGHHAVSRRYPRHAVAWAALATDGAQRGLDHQGARWADLPDRTTDQLFADLDALHRWESEDDPAGRALPRSKRHDDKTLVIWQPDPNSHRGMTTGKTRLIQNGGSSGPL